MSSDIPISCGNFCHSNWERRVHCNIGNIGHCHIFRYTWDGLNNLKYSLSSRDVQEKFTILNVRLERGKSLLLKKNGKRVKNEILQFQSVSDSAQNPRTAEEVKISTGNNTITQ